MSNEPEFLLDSEKEDESKVQVERREGEPTPAFIGASWAALILGVGAYLIGLFNATMELNEKGYYFAVLIVGLYSSISLRSEEHTSELQSRFDLVCRLLLEKKNLQHKRL